ncbi:MAG: family 78 glycoside hydrolase catalytic domain [Clostridia bacterium]
MSIQITNLTVNYLDAPIGIDELPRFSWRLIQDGRGNRQSAYRITVKRGGHLSWDSGVIESDDSILIEYKGEGLKPRMRYGWKVTVTDRYGRNYVSETAFFETAKLDEPWKGRFIQSGFRVPRELAPSSPYLRKRFNCEGTVKKAILYIAGAGFFETYINNRKICDHLMDPPYTAYDRTLLYYTFDVTRSMEKGANMIGVLLGNGFFSMPTVDQWATQAATWKGSPKLICELHITTDTGEEIIVSDDTWECHMSPITFNSLRNGEYYDARLEIPGWCDAGASVSDWAPAEISRDPGGILKANEMQSVRIDREFPAVSVKKMSDTSYLFDFGQNMAGFVKIKVAGAKDTQYVIKMNEKLKPTGELDTVQNAGFTKSGEFQTDRYTKKSDKEEIWQPRFVYHGFRYALIDGFTYEPDLSAATALFLHTDCRITGEFSCSDRIINTIQKNTRMSTFSNMYGLLTDSPHREKNAWTGDTNCSTEQLIFNCMTGPLWVKWLNDIKDSMKAKGNIPCMVPTGGWGYNWGNGPDYSSILTWLPDNMYLYYEDRTQIEKYYVYMKRNMEYMLSMMIDDVCVNDYGVGDWCAPFDGPALSVNMSAFKAPIDLTDTACMYTMATSLMRLAEIQKNENDVKYYNSVAKRIKAGFRRKFFDEDTCRLKGDGQTCYAAMLYHGLYENKKEYAELFKQLLRTIDEAKGHLDYGILGNKYVNNILGVNNREDLIYSMVTNKTYPSFAHQIDELGATTLYECWNGEGSRNHHMFGDISATFFKYFAGITPDREAPGFRHFNITPGLNTPIEKVSCTYDSIRGKIESSYVKENGMTYLTVEIPVNSSATLTVHKDMRIYENEKLLGIGTVELESGRYMLEVRSNG